MSQTVKEILRQDDDIREFLVIADEKKKSVDIGMFSGLPEPRDLHPKNSDLAVWNTHIEKIEGLKFKALVYYKPVVPLIPRKEVISIQPGDVVTVTTPYELSSRATDKLKFNVAEMLPDGVNVIVLSGGATMEVYRERSHADKDAILIHELFKRLGIEDAKEDEAVAVMGDIRAYERDRADKVNYSE